MWTYNIGDIQFTNCKLLSLISNLFTTSPLDNRPTSHARSDSARTQFCGNAPTQLSSNVLFTYQKFITAPITFCVTPYSPNCSHSTINCLNRCKPGKNSIMEHLCQFLSSGTSWRKWFTCFKSAWKNMDDIKKNGLKAFKRYKFIYNACACNVILTCKKVH